MPRRSAPFVAPDYIDAPTSKEGEKQAKELLSTLQTDIAAYRHGLRIGVVVSLEDENADTGKNLAMHIAAFNPVAVDDENVAADVLAREKDIIEAKAKESGKPDNIVEKMIEGGLRKYLDEVLYYVSHMLWTMTKKSATY